MTTRPGHGTLVMLKATIVSLGLKLHVVLWAQCQRDSAGRVAVDDFDHDDVAPFLELRVDLILRIAERACDVMLVNDLAVEPNLAAVVAPDEQLDRLIDGAVGVGEEVVGHAGRSHAARAVVLHAVDARESEGAVGRDHFPAVLLIAKSRRILSFQVRGGDAVLRIEFGVETSTAGIERPQHSELPYVLIALLER